MDLPMDLSCKQHINKMNACWWRSNYSGCHWKTGIGCLCQDLVDVGPRRAAGFIAAPNHQQG